MPRYSALVPAAGSGARFGAEIPKQYLGLAGRPMLYHTLSVLCECERIEHVWVVLSAGDEWWDAYDWKSLGPKLRVERCGGATRAESVANGLAAAAGVLRQDDWLLVHDAARPCLAPDRLLALCDGLADDPVGGLLAVPVADTLKRADGDRRVSATVPRDGLWQAQTPQMFRYGLLCRALAEHSGVTDEAGAIEAAGYRPRLIVSDTTNFKVTYPADLRLAELVLRGRKS
ncbi:2-C-methyl-D-erythritol 4-phosphate cytidylyltransferase [Propionivibrio limicola]|uniref:2-C-methyl-D-erythritol 4-phosphate cytidylyltransferase n=1 Tax=Propionivibrio limicola TaxID=167645 RepID=UPI001B879CDA|nr:2-C-methyl-D-erythritol 4-phosphate cytidylyltransferase [Propionivibrio limicola]